MQHKEVVNLSLKDLVPYEAQPFHVIDDEAMTELAESVKIVGVLVPIIVRQIKNNKYEIISGHRRKRACEIAGVTEIPATIMELDDDEAAIMLVDCNLQRENLLPSEKAYAYKLKLDAIKHQGKREILDADDEILLISSEIIGKDADKSGRQIRRYIRLTELILDLLDKVDKKIIPVTAGAEISFLNVKMQVALNNQIEFVECKVNLQQAKKLKKKFLDGTLNEDEIFKILSVDEIETTLSIDYSKLRKYFPANYTRKQCENALWDILEEWKERNCA
ncbi:MAG: ParB/RepB/Spo0J family partition protein [Clostridia bacterium]|nr:ParB/RepB/Spo0J family partition protein [Clostridia bacterium]